MAIGVKDVAKKLDALQKVFTEWTDLVDKALDTLEDLTKRVEALEKTEQGGVNGTL